MIADYTATGISVEQHPLQLLRARLTELRAFSTAGLASTPHGTSVCIGGLVIARQRPGTANGIVFLLIEDEHGTLNVIVPPALYEQRRLEIRTEPLILVTGRLERHTGAGGAVNLLATSIERLAPGTGQTARVQPLRPASPEPATPAGDFNAAAPAVTSFGQGRR